MMPFTKKSPLDFIGSSVSNTPDFEELNKGKKRFFPLFVYDGLQSDKKHFKNLIGEKTPYFGRATTLNSDFKCYYAYEGEPVAMDGFNRHNIDCGHVCGELFAVSLRHLTQLDYLYDNGQLYTRERRYIQLDNPKYSSNNQRYVYAYMYIGVKKELEEFNGGPFKPEQLFKQEFRSGERYFKY